MSGYDSSLCTNERMDDVSYIRSRLEPSLCNANRFHFSDILLFLRQRAVSSGALLDYGCGGAPYASLFAGCEPYVRADIESRPGVDAMISPEGRLALPDESFDVVLSTQVLEHVPDVIGYLREAYRLLRPEGTLILVTHGLYEEHGCPCDYQRWTAEGLTRQIAHAGFVVETSCKLTNGMRAAPYWMHAVLVPRRRHENRVISALEGIWTRGFNHILLPVAHICLHGFTRLAVLPGSHYSSVYLSVGIVARRPSQRGTGPDRLPEHLS